MSILGKSLLDGTPGGSKQTIDTTSSVDSKHKFKIVTPNGDETGFATFPGGDRYKVEECSDCGVTKTTTYIKHQKVPKYKFTRKGQTLSTTVYVKCEEEKRRYHQTGSSQDFRKHGKPQVEEKKPKAQEDSPTVVVPSLTPEEQMSEIRKIIAPPFTTEKAARLNDYLKEQGIRKTVSDDITHLELKVEEELIIQKALLEVEISEFFQRKSVAANVAEVMRKAEFLKEKKTDVPVTVEEKWEEVIRGEEDPEIKEILEDHRRSMANEQDPLTEKGMSDLEKALRNGQIVGKETIDEEPTNEQTGAVEMEGAYLEKTLAAGKPPAFETPYFDESIVLLKMIHVQLGKSSVHIPLRNTLETLIGDFLKRTESKEALSRVWKNLEAPPVLLHLVRELVEL